ncbi:MAG: type II secretion system protein M [Xanthomonadales bacterium]|nr:type II secretion system protein M [Xanthomonadales bacterium]
MKTWWQDLQQREQQLILGGSIALLAVILWAFVWLPYQQNKDSLQTQIHARGQQLVEITQIAAQAKAAGKSPQTANSTAARGNRSLLQITDESARAAGLAAALKRIEPDTDKQVQVWLENANFDKLITWLEVIEGKYSIRIESASINKVSKKTSGAVNARISLREQ